MVNGNQMGVGVRREINVVHRERVVGLDCGQVAKDATGLIEGALRGGGYGLFTGCAAGDTGMAVVLEVCDA